MTTYLIYFREVGSQLQWYGKADSEQAAFDAFNTIVDSGESPVTLDDVLIEVAPFDIGAHITGVGTVHGYTADGEPEITWSDSAIAILAEVTA